MFVNISNHPSTRWEESQRQEALELDKIGEGSIMDVKFPAVPPEAGGDDIETLADQVAASVPESTIVAMVSGEFCLTMAIVLRLQRRGITCVAATTRRDTIETMAPDGSVVKTAVFRFVRFRRFPQIGG